MINKPSKLTRIISSITLATALLSPIRASTESPKLEYSPQTIESQAQINQDYSWILRKSTQSSWQSSNSRKFEPVTKNEESAIAPEEVDLDIKNLQNQYIKTPEELQKEKLNLMKKRALENLRTSVNGLDFITGLKYDLSELTEKNSEDPDSPINERQKPKFRMSIRNKGELDFRIQKELYSDWLGEIGTQADYSGIGGNISISKELKDKSKIRISAGEEIQKGVFLKFDYGFSY